jgi:hypothetical protein
MVSPSVPTVMAPDMPAVRQVMFGVLDTLLT